MSELADLEDAILAKILREGQIPPEVQGDLTPDLFSPAKRALAAAIFGVSRRIGVCDLPAVVEELRRNGAGDDEIQRALRLLEATPSAAGLSAHVRLLLERTRGQSPSWPALDAEGLYGLAGEIVLAIEPYTEADPVGILAHTLTAFGCIIGPGPHFRVEFTRHYPRLFVCLVGETSKARKGQSWSAPRFLFRQVDEGWVTTRVTQGLSSGEGLIFQVRDPRIEQQPIRRGGRVDGYQEVVVDHGAPDKRLLLVEEEFSGPLKVMGREGNILSAIIRQAWDVGNLHPLTKNNPISATGAHIAIVAHITRDELLRHLSEVEQANGFANRFIWLLVRRSKVIANPTGVPPEFLRPLAEALGRALAFARDIGEMRRDPQAEGTWAEVYPALSQGKRGLLGAVIARGEAQVMRLACLYALLDRSALVGPAHLRAALAVWDHAETSASRIFGGRLGDPVADRILEALRAAPEGLDRTEIRDLFRRHCTADEIDRGLDLLRRQGLARCTDHKTAGRPRTVWRATKAT